MFSENMVPFWTAIAAIVAALGIVGGLITWMIGERRRAHELKVAARDQRDQQSRASLQVRRVVDAADPDLPAAYDVYSDGITNPDERDSFTDIQRWLDEAKAARANGKLELDEYLLIGKVNAKVCAFFYGQYYVSQRMFLIGYLVIDRKNRDARRATSSDVLKMMFEHLRADHPECDGVIFELALEEGKDIHTRIGKEDRFAVQARSIAGITVKRIDIDYYQPRLSIWDPASHAQRQHLMYGRVRGAPIGHDLPKQEVVKVLDTIYNNWYGDYYVDDQAKDLKYRAYVRRLFGDTIQKLPERIATL